MNSDAALWRRLLSEAGSAPQLFVPRIEPHPAALVVGLAGTALGIWTARSGADWAWRVELGWLALALAVAGMLMFVTLRRSGVGWRVDFAARQVQPQGEDGRSATLDGPGWRLFCVAGSKRRSLALEFRHEDGGRPLRVLQTRAGASKQEHQLVSQLADAIAQRLSVPREGLSLSL